MPDDLPQRVLHELSELRASGLLAAELALAAVLVGLALRPERSRRALFLGVMGFIGCVAVWAILAWQQRWVCDDAFISFRYARNWIEGQGLVFNPGERVEGYTNFLWTALIAATLRLQIDPAVSTVVLGFASALVALALCWKLSGDLSPRPGVLLVAPSVVLLAGNHLFAQYTTSGLETMFAATLSLFALERAINGRRLTAGFAGVLATMAHPDHALAYAALFLALCLDPAAWRGGVRGLFAFLGPYLLPFFLLYLPYFICKGLYYGSFVPNTYYAKSAGETYFSQGFKYLLISATSLGLLGALPLAAVSLFVLRTSLLARYVAVLGPTYLFYVAKIGGDFMLGRLLVLLLLPLAVLLDAGAQALFARGGQSRVASVLGCVAASSLLVPLPIVRPFEKYNHVADEQTFYSLHELGADGVTSQLTDMASKLKLALARVSGTDLPTMVTGCVGIIGYLTGLRIVDAYGLTDPHVARQPVAERGRPGHEKLISLVYALDAGGDFTDLGLWPARFNRFTQFHVNEREYYLLAHRPQRVAGWKNAPNVRLPDTSQQLQFYHPRPDQLSCDLWFFDTFYFRYHPHAEKLSFVQRLVDEGSLDQSLQDFESLSAGEHPQNYALVRSFELDAPEREGFQGTPDTVAAWTAAKAPLGQSEIGNARGGSLDSFSPLGRDDSEGDVASPVFVIEGDVLELYVAGGNHADVQVTLEVDRQEVARTSGCECELLGRRLWSVTEYKGRRARIWIHDHARGPWGHVIVDHISEWRATPSSETASSRPYP